MTAILSQPPCVNNGDGGSVSYALQLGLAAINPSMAYVRNKRLFGSDRLSSGDDVVASALGRPKGPNLSSDWPYSIITSG